MKQNCWLSLWRLAIVIVLFIRVAEEVSRPPVCCYSPAWPLRVALVCKPGSGSSPTRNLPEDKASITKQSKQNRNQTGAKVSRNFLVWSPASTTHLSISSLPSRRVAWRWTAWAWGRRSEDRALRTVKVGYSWTIEPSHSLLSIVNSSQQSIFSVLRGRIWLKLCN